VNLEPRDQQATEDRRARAPAGGHPLVQQQQAQPGTEVVDVDDRLERAAGEQGDAEHREQAGRGRPAAAAAGEGDGQRQRAQPERRRHHGRGPGVDPQRRMAVPGVVGRVQQRPRRVRPVDRQHEQRERGRERETGRGQPATLPRAAAGQQGREGEHRPLLGRDREPEQEPGFRPALPGGEPDGGEHAEERERVLAVPEHHQHRRRDQDRRPDLRGQRAPAGVGVPEEPADLVEQRHRQPDRERRQQEPHRRRGRRRLRQPQRLADGDQGRQQDRVEGQGGEVGTRLVDEAERPAGHVAGRGGRDPEVPRGGQHPDPPAGLVPARAAVPEHRGKQQGQRERAREQDQAEHDRRAPGTVGRTAPADPGHAAVSTPGGAGLSRQEAGVKTARARPI